MNLNFVRKKENLHCVDFAGGSILEMYEDKTPEGSAFRAFDYSLKKNVLREIAPEIKKTQNISLVNCIYESDRFYFASCEETAENMLFSFYEYNFSDGKTKHVFGFSRDKTVLSASEKIIVFILTPSYFLIQSESTAEGDAKSQMGIISFSLSLYDADAGKFLDVEIPDLKNNGINTIIPVSENRIMIKCGYSFLEDDRFSALSEKEALIESIYLTSSSQLIADISLNKTTGSMQLIDTAYFEKCIRAPALGGNFIYYEKVDVIRRAADINFVNTATLERYTYRKEEYENRTAFWPLVIHNTPYIRIKSDDAEKFMNLKAGRIDMEFSEEEFIAAEDRIIIFRKNRGKNNCLRIYSYPSLNMICEEADTFAALCCRGDEYYIYI